MKISALVSAAYCCRGAYSLHADIVMMIGTHLLKLQHVQKKSGYSILCIGIFSIIFVMNHPDTSF